MKKLLAGMLAVLLILSMLAVAPVSAAQLKSEVTCGHISENSEFYNRYREAIDFAAQEMYDLKTTVDISDYRVPLDDRRTLFTTIMHTHPELFFVSNSYSVSYYEGSGVNYIYTLNIHWGRIKYREDGSPIIENNRYAEQLYSADEVMEMRREFLARAQWYLDKVDDSMSDFDKALILHDELALNASYLLTGEIYDLMVNDRGKCYGYSECYSYLLAQVGVDTEIVESEPMNHQWNKVKIDGTYYHVDVTWDDPTPDKPGFVNHTFFLMSDAAAEGYEANPHYRYHSEFPSNDTRFDNMRFRKINTKMCYVDGEIYLVDNAFSGETAGELLTYDLSSDRFETVVDFSDERWRTGGGNSYWTKRYMSLAEYDGFLYMNTQKTVYVFDTVDETLAQFASNTYNKGFFGLRVIEGKVYAVLSDDPNTTGTLQYVGDCIIRERPTTEEPTTEPPTTEEPTTEEPTTEPPTEEPTTVPPTEEPTTVPPTEEPTTVPPTEEPTTVPPTEEPTTVPPTEAPTTEPPAAEDTYVIVGAPKSIFGTLWDADNADNQMEKNEDGTYEKTYTVTKGYNNIAFKLVENGSTWISNEGGEPITFNMRAAGDFTIIYDPAEGSITISGDNVSETPSFLYSAVYVTGNGEGAWLNGADWNPDDERNRMHEVAKDVWEIAYEGVADAFDRQFRFAIDGAEYDFFGGSFSESGAVTDAVYQGGSIIFDTEDDSQTVKLQLDLRNFDYATKTGATFTVTIIPDDPMGDLDGDGEVTINDATLLLACLAEFQELDDAQRVLADVNRDGRVDVRDVTAIQRILAEIDI